MTIYITYDPEDGRTQVEDTAASFALARLILDRYESLYPPAGEPSLHEKEEQEPIPF